MVELRSAKTCEASSPPHHPSFPAHTSYGYRSSSGSLVHQSIRHDYGRAFLAGDTIGCLIDFETPAAEIAAAEAAEGVAGRVSRSAGPADAVRQALGRSVALALAYQQQVQAPPRRGAQITLDASELKAVSSVAPMIREWTGPGPARGASNSGSNKVRLEPADVQRVVVLAPGAPKRPPWATLQLAASSTAAASGALASTHSGGGAGAAAVPGGAAGAASTAPPEPPRAAASFPWSARLFPPSSCGGWRPDDPEAPRDGPANTSHTVNKRFWGSSLRFFVNGVDQVHGAGRAAVSQSCQHPSLPCIGNRVYTPHGRRAPLPSGISLRRVFRIHQPWPRLFVPAAPAALPGCCCWGCGADRRRQCPALAAFERSGGRPDVRGGRWPRLRGCTWRPSSVASRHGA